MSGKLLRLDAVILREIFVNHKPLLQEKAMECVSDLRSYIFDLIEKGQPTEHHKSALDEIGKTSLELNENKTPTQVSDEFTEKAIGSVFTIVVANTIKQLLDDEVLKF